MGKVAKKQMPMWADTGHRRPVTRREFLAHGLIPFAASALVPNVLGLLAPNRAHAAECPEGSSLAPFITLNLAGGAGLSANYIPRNQSMMPLKSYTKMGMGNNSGANALGFEREFGVASFAKSGATISGLIKGIRDNCMATTLADTAFVALCVQSRDDSSENKFDASGMIFKAGLIGTRIPNLGTQSTSTGIGQKPSFVSPPAPLVVRSFNDLVNSIGYTRALAAPDGLSRPQQSKLARLVASLTSSQSAKLQEISSTAHVIDLLDCAGIKNIGLVEAGAGAVSPAANGAVLSRWGINATALTSQSASMNVVLASMVYNGLLGQAGTVSLELGGYDYHDRTRTTGDTKDERAGAVIGKILDTARLLGRKCFLYVTSDGSVTSALSEAPGAPWLSDRGDAGLAMIFMYQPPALGGRVATTGFQIGHFTDSQSADNTTVVGASPEVAAQAVLANYLKFNQRMELFNRVVPRGLLEGAVLESVIKVG